MPQEARVGIKFESIGIQDVLQQIGSLAEALGQAGRVAVNPYNPALSMSGVPGTQGAIQAAGEPGTFSSGGYPNATMGPGFQTPMGPGYQTSGGGFAGASINIGKVDVLNVQSASVVNIFGGTSGGPGGGGGGFVGGGGMGYGPAPGGGGTITPYGTIRDPGGMGGGGVSDAGLNRYYSQMQSGATSSDFVSWQQQQYGQWVNGGGQGSFADYLNGAGGGRGLAGMFGRGAAGAYALRASVDLLSQEASGQALSDQQRAIAGLQTFSIPFIGNVFQPEINRLQMEGSIADRAQMMGRTTGAAGISERDYEYSAQGSGRNFWRTPFLQWDRFEGKYQYNIGPFSNDPRRDAGFSYIPSGDANELVGLAGGGQIGMTTHRQQFEWLGEEIDDPNMRPATRKARAQAINQVRAMAVNSSPELAKQLIAGGNIRGVAPELLALAQMQGDFGGIDTIASAYDTKYDIDVYRQGAANTRLLATQGTLAQQGTAAAGIHIQFAQATQQGGYAIAGAIGGEAAALDAEIATKQSQLTLAEQQNGQAPTLQGQTIVNQRRNELQQLQAQRAASPIRQIDSQYQADIALSQASAVRGQSGLQLATTMGLMPGSETSTAFAQIQAGDAARLAALEDRLQKTRAAYPNAGPDVIAPLEAEIAQQRNTITGRPFQIIDDTYRRQRGMGDAMVGQGEAAFGLLQGTYSTDVSAMHAAFGQQAQGLEGRLQASRQRLAALRARGLGDNNTEVQQTLAQIAQDESASVMNPAREREGIFQGLSAVGGFAVEGGRSALGMAFRSQGFGGASERAQAAIMSGLNEQLDAAVSALAATLRSPHTPGQERLAQSRVAQAQASIQAGIQDYAQMAAQDLFGRVGQAGTIAGIGITGVTGAGFAPTPEMQQQRRGGIEAQAAQAEQNARNTSDPAQKRQWEQQAAQLRAQLMTLPMQEIEENLAPAFRTATAQQGIASSNVFIARQGGAGSADTRSMEFAGVRAAEQEAEVASQRVAELRKLGGSIDPSLVTAAEAQEAAALAKAAQMRTGLGQITLPLAMREQQEVTSYSLNVLQNMPGAYGNIRGLLQQQMSNLEGQASYLQREYAARGEQGDAEGQHMIRQQMREVGLQQAQTFQQMNVGWEGRLLNQMSGNPGAFNLEGRGFSYRDAVTRWGVVNPHMGMTGRQMPFFLRQASLMGGPGMIPGQRTLDSDHTGTLFGGDIGPEGFEHQGHRNWPAGARMSFPGVGADTPEGTVAQAAGGRRGSRGGRGGADIVVEVVIKDSKDRELARGSGSSGAVSMGLAQGGLGDILGNFGISVARQN